MTSMNYRRLGRSGLRVSELSFGSWVTYGNQIDERVARECMPVAIDPSHSVGTRAAAPDGLLDVFHVVAQGVVAGANVVLVDFHPDPSRALVDGPQALLLSELPHFLADVALARETYERRVARAREAART